MPGDRISVYMPAGEAREAKVRAAIQSDKQCRFEWSGNSSEIPCDVRFQGATTILHEYPYSHRENVFNVELKDFTGRKDDNSDLLSSILNGRLYLQTLKLRKAGQPCAIVILGNEEDLKNACMKSAYHRGLKGEAATDLMITYENMVWDFEANCRGQNIGVWWLKSVPWKRILSNVHKILTEADLSRYAPKPVEGEEQAVALSILAGNGIGPGKAKSILEKFRIWLLPKISDACLTDCDGIGEKLALQLFHSKDIQVPSQNVCRPKVKKPKKGAMI